MVSKGAGTEPAALPGSVPGCAAEQQHPHLHHPRVRQCGGVPQLVVAPRSNLAQDCGTGQGSAGRVSGGGGSEGRAAEELSTPRGWGLLVRREGAARLQAGCRKPCTTCTGAAPCTAPSGVQHRAQPLTAAHDLAGARLGKAGRPVDDIRRGDGPNRGAHLREQVTAATRWSQEQLGRAGCRGACGAPAGPTCLQVQPKGALPDAPVPRGSTCNLAAAKRTRPRGQRCSPPTPAACARPRGRPAGGPARP